MPFADDIFDGLFTNASLHERSQPKKVFDEVYKVLKHGGRYSISDLRRNMNLLAVHQEGRMWCCGYTARTEGCAQCIYNPKS
jgi:ubiquinone/menaquinone biosynthesis C-methylase UbiE